MSTTTKGKSVIELLVLSALIFAQPADLYAVELLGSTPWTEGLTHTAESGSYRALIFTAHVQDNYTDMDVTSVTYGGQSMTKVIEQNHGTVFRSYVAAFILDEAGINAASSNTFNVTWAQNPSSAPGYSSVFLGNVIQSTPIGASEGNGISSGYTVTTNPLSTNNGDLVVVAGTHNNSGIYSLNNGFTKAIELTVESGDGVAGYKQATGVNETPSITHSSSSNSRQVIIGFVVQTWDASPPTPDPMTWASVPAATGPNSISMTATTASDPSGVEYYFTCTAGGGNDSGWQDDPNYEDTGLAELMQYTYTVKARDKSPNQNGTAPSSEQSATTEDGTAPAPDPMTWAFVPYATGPTSISMRATTANDQSGVEYYFTCTAGGGNDSGWQDDPTYEDVDLSEFAQYTYRVKARDKSPNQNETASSTPASATVHASNTLLVAESGGDYDTIQAAIDACSDGWIVAVYDGFWGGTGNRDLDFDGKAITVRSVNGPENCIIDCGGTSTTPHRAFYFHSGEDANSIVEGFTIMGGYAKYDASVPGMDDPHGGAIYCVATLVEDRPSSPTIRNCIITNNQVEGDYGHGGGIFCSASSPIISGCVISSNSANFGGGICCEHFGYLETPVPVPKIINCTISDNTAMCSVPDEPTFFGNGYGGGIYLKADSSVVIENCTIIGNSAFWGGGIACNSVESVSSYPNLDISRSVISSNSATYADPCSFPAPATGGGIAMWQSCSGVISECTITGNAAMDFGGGIDCVVTSALEIVNCIISGNVADSGNVDIPSAGGGICCYGASPTIVNCTIGSNEAHYIWQEFDYYGGGGGIYCEEDWPLYSKPIIKNCIFENNGGHAIREGWEADDPNLSFCLFNNNPDGDYYDWDMDDTFTGADNINSIPDGFAIENMDGDPRFFMNDPNKPQEAEDPNWTDEPSLSGNRTTLYDSMASFAVGELVGRHINANMSDPNQRRQAYITANTATTIEVVGDLTGYVAKGDKYKIMDYHLRGDSPCIDTGTSSGSPTIDIEGNPRPIDAPGVANVTEGNPSGDGIVDIDDILVIANNWLRDDCQGAGSCGGADIGPPGGDGVVNYLDFAAVNFNWFVEALYDIGAYEFQIDN